MYLTRERRHRSSPCVSCSSFISKKVKDLILKLKRPEQGRTPVPFIFSFREGRRNSSPLRREKIEEKRTRNGLIYNWEVRLGMKRITRVKSELLCQGITGKWLNLWGSGSRWRCLGSDSRDNSGPGIFSGGEGLVCLLWRSFPVVGESHSIKRNSYK